MDDLFNRVARRRREGQRGFTLIELLVVIAVLAILAAIVIFNVLGVTNRGKSSAACTDEKTIQTASDAYFNDVGKYPEGSANTGGALALAAATTAGHFVDLDELHVPTQASSGGGPIPPPYIHTVPNLTNDGAFTYNSTSGTVVAANAAAGC